MLTIKVTLKEALQRQKDLTKELKASQFKIIKLGNLEFRTPQQDKELEELLKIQKNNHENIVLIKLSLRKGIGEKLITDIFELTEFKEEFKCYTLINAKEQYNSILTELNKKIQETEKRIDAVNTATVIDLFIKEPDVELIKPKN